LDWEGSDRHMIKQFIVSIILNYLIFVLIELGRQWKHFSAAFGDDGDEIGLRWLKISKIWENWVICFLIIVMICCWSHKKWEQQAKLEILNIFIEFWRFLRMKRTFLFFNGFFKFKYFKFIPFRKISSPQSTLKSFS